MKTYLLLLICTLCLSATAQNEISPESEIADVTVYLSGAQITRSANVNLSKGENLITLAGLAQGMNPNSINVKGNNNFLIKSVKHSVDFTEDAAKSMKSEELEKLIDDLDFKVSTRRKLMQVYNDEKSLLLSNKSIKGESEVLLAEDLKEMAAFFREHLEELEYKLLEVDLEIADLKEERRNLQIELNKSRNGLNQYSSSVEIMVNAERDVTTKIFFTYIVYNAKWYATYDVRTTDVNEPVQMAYKANISQFTGVDWDGVNITLSTGNPMVNGNKPDLKPWYLSNYNPQKTYGWYNDNKRKQEDSYEGEEPLVMFEQDMRAIGNNSAGDELARNYELGASYVVTNSIEALITTEFQVSVPYDIPADNESYEVEIQRNELKSDFAYYTAPPLDTDAYLLARLTEWSDFNLLPGDANVFYQGAFVGTSFLDPYSTEDTLDVSLGKDKNIIISREKIDDFCKTSSFGGNKKTSRAFKITVKNNKSTPISIKVQDQVPVSQRNDIDVSVEELSNGILDEKTGLVTWELNLAAGESEEMTLSYEVKYPKKVKLAKL